MAVDAAEDVPGRLGPGEGARVVVVFGNVAADGCLEVDDRAEVAPLQPPGQSREEAFDGIDPGRGGRGEVEHTTGMARQPRPHPRVLVDGIVVQNGMDDLAGRLSPLDGVPVSG